MIRDIHTEECSLDRLSSFLTQSKALGPSRVPSPIKKVILLRSVKTGNILILPPENPLDFFFNLVF